MPICISTPEPAIYQEKPAPKVAQGLYSIIQTQNAANSCIPIAETLQIPIQDGGMMHMCIM